MVEEACACEAGCGLFHSHVWRPVSTGTGIVMRDDGAISIWVDWKAVARALIHPSTRS